MPPSDDSRPPSNLAVIVLPETGDRLGSGSIESIMAGVVLSEMARVGVDNQTIREIRYLSHIRQLALHNPG
jgi:hypothetical protein